MAISPFGWHDLLAGGTALDAANLEAANAHAGAYTDAETTRAGAAEALLAPKASPTFTGVLTAPIVDVGGATGTSAGRLIGLVPAGGPTVGTWLLDDVGWDNTGKWWICTAGGTPGTWATPATGGGGGGLTPIAKAVNYTAANGDAVLATAAITVTAPALANGSSFSVTNEIAAGGVVTIAQHTGDKFIGPGLAVGGATSLTLGAYGQTVRFTCDGANWHYAAGHIDSGWVDLTSSLTNSWTAFSAGGAVGAPVQVAIATLNTAGTTTTATLTNPVTAGNLLKAVIVDFTGTVSLVTGLAPGSGADVWTRDGATTITKPGGTGNGVGEMWTAPNSSGASPSVTATFSAAPTGGGVFALMEIPGAATSSPLDGAPVTGTGTSSTGSFTSSNFTPTQTGDAIFGLVLTQRTPPSASGAGWVEVQRSGGGATFVSLATYADLVYFLDGTTAAEGLTVTVAAGGYGFMLVGIKAAGGTPVSKPMLRKIGGRVELRGQIAPGAGSPSNALTIPAGYRPSTLIKRTVAADGDLPVQVTVTTAGVLTVTYPPGYTNISLDGIDWYTN